MSCQRNSSGVTMLELVLVLVIAASIFAYGLRVYQQFQFQANEQKILANVDQLFQALEGYYYFNCRQAIDQSSQAQTPGKLDPINAPNTTVVLAINNDLIPAFIPAAQFRPNNPLLDNTPNDSGYFVQFNRVLTSGGMNPVMSVSACVGDAAPPSCNQTNGQKLESDPDSPTGQSVVAIWKAQVAVKISTSFTLEQWTRLKNDLNADCISTKSGSGIAPCTPSTPVPTPPTGYLVWTRMPAAYNPNISSVYWASNPYVTQFNRQYTNDPMATLSGVVNETTSGPDKWYNPLNFLCGG